MKKILICLTAGMLMLGAQSLLADASTNSTSSSTTHGPGDHKELTPEQRKERMAAMLKMVGLTPADLKGLSPEDRQAKIKGAAEKKVAELKAQKASGTLSDEDQKHLDHLEKFLAHAGHRKAQDPSNN